MQLGQTTPLGCVQRGGGVFVDAPTQFTQKAPGPCTHGSLVLGAAAAAAVVGREDDDEVEGGADDDDDVAAAEGFFGASGGHFGQRIESGCVQRDTSDGGGDCDDAEPACCRLPTHRMHTARGPCVQPNSLLITSPFLSQSVSNKFASRSAASPRGGTRNRRRRRSNGLLFCLLWGVLCCMCVRGCRECTLHVTMGSGSGCVQGGSHLICSASILTHTHTHSLSGGPTSLSLAQARNVVTLL